MECKYKWEKQTGVGPVILPCGKCMPCRIHKREVWTGRILMESLCHEHAVFVTLTYAEAPEQLINGKKRQVLVKRHGQLFMKKLRKRLSPRKIRFFFCGEYGSKTERPHYHAVLFGLSTASTADIEKSWGHGFVSVSDLTPQRARYVARYTTKKLVGALLSADGRPPEYATMSLRGPIGHPFLERLASTMNRNRGSGTVVLIPSTIKLFGKNYPLDPLFRQRLNELVNPPEEGEELMSMSRRLSYGKEAEKPIPTHDERASAELSQKRRDQAYRRRRDRI